jgi:glycosyltransferase involved in cell wall biosynthesis
MDKKQLTNIVWEVLEEMRLLDNPAPKTTFKRVKRPCPFPAVLIVFHPGVRYLNIALEQVKQIEKVAGKSSVFTVPSARAWVCGQDVREQSGCKCILDTVKPAGLEKALQKADILVLPTFCFKTAAKVAQLINDSSETDIVLSALMQGKPVLAANDGFGLLETLCNEGIRKEIQVILGKLQRFGMVFCKTEGLAVEFEKMVSDRLISAEPTAQEESNPRKTPASGLISAKDVQIAVDNKQPSIHLAPGGIVTPLAKDQAKAHAIKIIRES